MTIRHSAPTWRRLATTLLLGCVASSAGAAPLVALRADNSMIFFDSTTPGTLNRTIPLGVPASETAVGFDLRPATGQLYLLTSPCNYVYVIDAPRGLASLRSPATCVPIGLPPPPVLTGIDFNPTVDRIRYVDAGGTNLRFNPDTGVLAATDTPTSITGISAVAYTSNVAGATSTTLYGIDTNADQLVTIGGPNGTPSPNGGVTTPVGPLGVAATDASFEILADGTALAALAVGGTTGLYTINLATGAATLVGTIGTGAAVVGFAGSPGFTAPIPSVSTTGLALLGAFLAMLGFMAWHRRGA